MGPSTDIRHKLTTEGGYCEEESDESEADRESHGVCE